jgi:hypothetical protein
MLDGKQLRKKFGEFNAQYFNNRLPPYSIRVVPEIKSDSIDGHVYGRCKKKRRLIEIRQGLRDEEAISTLLHEMAHAGTNDGHGPKWWREMIRLREAGAPLTAFDHHFDFGGRRVTKRMFASHVWGFLCQGLMLTLPQAISLFIMNNGYNTATVSTFRKKYPWAGAVLKDIKKAFREDQKGQAELKAEISM